MRWVSFFESFFVGPLLNVLGWGMAIASTCRIVKSVSDVEVMYRRQSLIILNPINGAATKYLSKWSRPILLLLSDYFKSISFSVTDSLAQLFSPFCVEVFQRTASILSVISAAIWTQLSRKQAVIIHWPKSGTTHSNSGHFYTRECWLKTTALVWEIPVKICYKSDSLLHFYAKYIDVKSRRQTSTLY